MIRAILDPFDADDLWALLTDQGIADQLGIPPDVPRPWVLDEVTSVTGGEGRSKQAVANTDPRTHDVVVLTGSRHGDRPCVAHRQTAAIGGNGCCR